VIAQKFDRVTCYPVGQKDGGRDITHKAATGVSSSKSSGRRAR
jgi:hypothetical protein